MSKNIVDNAQDLGIIYYLCAQIYKIRYENKIWNTRFGDYR